MKKYLITSALPYANGPLHFGHIAGVYLPADIYTRHRKLQEKKVLHICGSDEHGVAIMQNAQKAKKSYQEYVNEWHHNHKALFDLYQIHFDYFGQTSADYHKEEVLVWFKELYEKGFIEKKVDQQLQCMDCLNYLPDRYVEGTCYVCGYNEARGDECPSCGTWIDALKLINPVCKFCASTNIKTQDVDQWYLMLSKYHAQYREWFETKNDWRKAVKNFVDSLSEKEMVNRAITRDLDWGIDVPLEEAKNKKLYVWFDAPIGYVSNTKQALLAMNSSEDYLVDWWQNPKTEITHFIGKDNIIFHAIIFPVMSLASGRVRGVDQLPANQYVNLAGKQFSKSKGWYVDAEEAINEFGSDFMRYYLTNLIPETNDSNFEWEAFEQRINGELANNIGNFMSRCFKFIQKNFPEGISSRYFESFWDSNECGKIDSHILKYHELMNEFKIKDSLAEIMSLGHNANLFFSDKAPWALIKEDREQTQKVLAWSVTYALTLGVFLNPFLPHLSEKILSYFKINQDIVNKVYQGELILIKTVFENGFKIEQEVEPLVPKIDSARIKELALKLTETFN